VKWDETRARGARFRRSLGCFAAGFMRRGVTLVASSYAEQSIAWHLFTQQPGTKSNRIAGRFPVTAGLPLSMRYIQSEQSVVGKGYSAFVVNNIAEHGEKDKLVDVLSLGPTNKPARGAERIDGDPVKHQWKSAWTNATAVSISMMPTMGGTSNRGNGGHAQPQLLPNGDLLCNSIGGPIWVRNQ
jgi:hypothetical protein